MRKIIFVLILLPMATTAFAQDASLTVFSDMPGIKFRLYLNGEKQNNFFQKKMELDSLQAGAYKVRVSFKRNGVADVMTEAALESGKRTLISIEKKKPLKQKFQRIGRKIGNKLNKEEGKNLKDPYYLKEVTGKEED